MCLCSGINVTCSHHYDDIKLAFHLMFTITSQKENTACVLPSSTDKKCETALFCCYNVVVHVDAWNHFTGKFVICFHNIEIKTKQKTKVKFDEFEFDKNSLF